MDEAKLRNALEGAGKPLGDKAVASRLSRARKAEGILGADLDEVVSDDDKMLSALVFLRDDERERNGNLQNAVRWYKCDVCGKVAVEGEFSDIRGWVGDVNLAVCKECM